MTDTPDPIATVKARLLDSSIEWRTAAGWVVVLVLAWRFLIFPIVNTIAVWNGHAPLPAPDQFSVGDAVALAGVPLVGFLVQR